MLVEPLNQTPELAKEVLSYFVDRPATLADLTQIARFRLQEQRAERMVERVGSALDWLVKERYLVQVIKQGTEPQFALNPDKHREARLFLEQDTACVKSQGFWLWLRSLSSHKHKENVAERTFFEQENDLHSVFTPGAPGPAHEEPYVPRHAEPPAAVTLHEAVAEPRPNPAAKSVGPEPAPADSTVPWLASRWLDRLLLARLAHLSEVPDQEGDHPGISRTYATVIRLLECRGSSEPNRRSASSAESDYLQALAHEPAAHHLAVAAQWLNLRREDILAITLALAPELDPVYQTVYGVLNDDMSRRVPTFGLACSLLGDPLAVRRTLADSGVLTRWRLIDSGVFWPRAEEPLRLDSGFLAWLLESADLLTDPYLDRFARAKEWPGATWVSRNVESERAMHLSAAQAGTNHWLTVLTGEDSDGWRAMLEAAANAVGAASIRVALPPAITNWESWGEASIRIARAFALREPGVRGVLDFASPEEGGAWDSAKLAAVIELLRESRRPVSVIAGHIEDVRGAISALSPEEFSVHPKPALTQADISSYYQMAAREAGLTLQPSEAERAAMGFPLPIAKIDAAMNLAKIERDPRDGSKLALETLLAALRSVSAPELPKFARRVRPAFSLKDIVLPQDRVDQLWEIVGHVKNSAVVLNQWGFGASLPYGRGVAALFSGPSGTGKTMAAHAIAHELHTEAFVIDLSRVLSKYIGESEKAFDVMFRDAQRAGAVLQIDEAEALFGKRSEVKDSHDRFSNLEVAYLLTRMELYDGLVILTSNLGQELDRAFLRRLRFVIDFPKPDAAAREEIWERSLPKEAPRETLNLKFLARRLDLTGGNIRQIAVRAAFAAVGENMEDTGANETGAKQIRMRHLVHATRAELLKLGMTSAMRDLDAYEASQSEPTRERQVV